MKTPRRLIVLFAAVSVWATAHDCPAQGVLWQPVPQEEVEFGVSAVFGDMPVQFPSVFETGYNGAYYFGFDGLSFQGMAQTFTIPSLRTLQSIELRVGRFSVWQSVSGQFEVAIYRFDALSGTPADKLAGVLANAQDYYQFDLVSNVPVSSFDFSSFNVSLNPAETYALAVTPTATFVGLLTLQAAGDIYPGGTAYSLTVVPEPNTIALCGLGTILSLVVGVARRRKI